MYTEKQCALIDFFIERFGFKNDQYKREYFKSLEDAFHIHEDLTQRSEWSKYWLNDEDLARMRTSGLIRFLIDEYELKMNHNLIDENNNKSNFITASDLANFTFCPVSYSIARTFEIPKNILGELGSEMHEQHRLLFGLKKHDLIARSDHIKSTDFQDYYSEFIDSETKSLFTDISASTCLFSGHHQDFRNAYYTNKEFNFRGQPDYIFQNSAGKFYIIEEKFKKNTISNTKYFFRNHKVQLASYIHFISEYEINYGYLVYWIYDYENNHPKIKYCRVLKIVRNDSSASFLKEKHDSLKEFIRRKYCNLTENNFIPRKCAYCVYVKFCGHKSRRRMQVTLKYQKGYLNLFSAKLPEILQQKENDEFESSINNES